MLHNKVFDTINNFREKKKWNNEDISYNTNE